MGRTFQQSCQADAANTVLNTSEFAVTVTLTKPTGGTAPMALGQRLALYDRLARLGLDPLSGGASEGSTSSITGQVFFDMEDEQQGVNVMDASGDRRIRMGRFVTDIDTDITTDDKPEVCDKLTISDEVWQCVRVSDRDLIAGLKTIVIRRDEKITTKTGKQRP
jgi:hypothetical protein